MLTLLFSKGRMGRMGFCWEDEDFALGRMGFCCFLSAYYSIFQSILLTLLFLIGLDLLWRPFFYIIYMETFSVRLDLLLSILLRPCIPLFFEETQHRFSTCLENRLIMRRCIKFYIYIIKIAFNPCGILEL